MIGRLAFRGLLDRPWRSLFLLAGFGLGVGVMITLLAIGEAMVTQARDEKLVGGGTVTVLPQGLDIEVMKTGGVGGMFVSIPNSRFVYRQLLASPRLADVVTAVAPQTDGVLLYVRTADGREHPVRAMGEIPSATRAVGAAPDVIDGAWDDDESDRRWLAPTAEELRHEIDHLHFTPPELGAEDVRTWGEWHYFNIISDDRRRWAFLTLAVGGDVPDGEWGGQVLLTVHEQGKPARRFVRDVPADRIAFDTTHANLRLGDDGVEVLPDGRYRVSAHAVEEGGSAETRDTRGQGGSPDTRDARGQGGSPGARARITLTVSPAPRAYFPGTAIGGEGLVSGYAVPALRASAEGELCVDGRCERFDAAQSYHDHNWGVWRDVEWEWGASRAGALTFLYGRVMRGGVEDVAEPLFLYLVDSLGFRALFRPREIIYEDTRTAVAPNGERIMVPARATMVDIRGADTLRVEITVEDAVVSAVRREDAVVSAVRREDAAALAAPPDDVTLSRRDASPVAGAGRGRRWFVQMKGVARLTGRIGGIVVQGEGTGFFETYR